MNLFSVELWQEFSRARFCSCPLPQCPQAHLSFSWSLPEPVCPGWKRRLPCTKQNCFGRKTDYGTIGIHVHSLLCWILTKNDPEPLAAVCLTPRPLLSLVMVLRCHASVRLKARRLCMFMDIWNGGEKGNRKEEGMLRMRSYKLANIRNRL